VVNPLTARTLLKKASLLLLCAGAIVLWGCDDNPPPSHQPKTNQLETGRLALQKMIPAARFWSPDAAPIRLASSTTSESNGHDGKAGFWRATFASRARQKSEPFSWSGMADAHRGVDHGIEDTYSPNNRSTQTWDLNYLKVDTDHAFEVAQKHGGKELLEKDPKQPIMYLLDFDPGSSQLRWHVIYGDTESTAKLTVIVDASSGLFMRKE
jgi:hypothetical protein